MEEKKFVKGCEAVAEAAIRAGCRFFAGYPITPQNEVPEYLSRRLPEVGGIFMQAESETAASAMCFGGGASGVRTLVSSSSIGISLMSESASWMAAAHLPIVICNFQRGGPGIGSIKGSQQDYNQATKAFGNGGHRLMVYSPSTLQEAVDMVYEAFDKAEEYRHPVMVLLDGYTGAVMEAVRFPRMKTAEELAENLASRTWAASGNKSGKGTERHFIGWFKLASPLDDFDAKMYAERDPKEISYETDGIEDADIILTSHGISARICRAAMEDLRAEGIKVGFIRPKKVYPFPVEAYDKINYEKIKGIISVELSIPAQFAEDVKAAVARRATVETVLASGGDILEKEDIIAAVRKMNIA